MKKNLIPIVLFIFVLGGGVLLFNMNTINKKLLEEKDTYKTYHDKVSAKVGTVDSLSNVSHNLLESITLLQEKKYYNKVLHSVVEHFCEFENSTYYFWSLEIDDSQKDLKEIDISFTSYRFKKEISLKK